MYDSITTTAMLRLSNRSLRWDEIAALLQYVLGQKMSVMYYEEPASKNSIRLGQTGELRPNHLIVRPRESDSFLTDPGVVYDRIVIEPHEWNEGLPTRESDTHPFPSAPTPTEVLYRLLSEAYFDGIKDGFPRYRR